jgi:competence protein ComEC
MYSVLIPENLEEAFQRSGITHVLAIYSQHCDVLAAVSYFALRILAVPSAARTLTTLAVIWVYILFAGALLLPDARILEVDEDPVGREY